MSLRKLAEEVDGAVSAQGIQKYEKGKAMPGSQILLALAEALGRPLDFFFRPLGPEIETISFRKHKSLSKKRQAAIRERVRDRAERYLELEDFVDSHVQFTRPGSGKAKSPEDAEAAAEAVREAWRLGRNPLPNVAEMLEEHGVRVIQIGDELGSDQNFKGCSGRADQMAFVALADWLDCDLPRKRFTALHELGHLVLDCGDLSSGEEEQLCHRFAGAMLLPAEAARTTIGRRREQVSLEELLLLKREYGISIGAILYRLKDLKIVSGRHHLNWQKKRNQHGWRKDEPGDYLGDERALRFDQLLARALTEGIISTSKAAGLSMRPLEDLHAERNEV